MSRVLPYISFTICNPAGERYGAVQSPYGKSSSGLLFIWMTPSSEMCSMILSLRILVSYKCSVCLREGLAKDRMNEEQEPADNSSTRLSPPNAASDRLCELDPAKNETAASSSN